MYNFSQEITRTAKNYNLQERDVIFCHLIAAGIDRADAYYCLYNRGSNKAPRSSREVEDTKAMEYLNNHIGMTLLIQKIKARKPINTTSTQQEVRAAQRYEDVEKEEGNNKKVDELKNRSGLIARTARELSQVHGKEAIQGLVSLAKLQGFDKEDSRPEEEKRRYFLPFRTKCRVCQLMKLYRQLEQQESEAKTE